MAQIRNEAGVKRAVKALLSEHGWFAWMPPANGYGRSGIADFHALKDGKFLAIETKFGSNKPTALQWQFLHSVEAAGGEGIVIGEANLGQLADLLARP